MCAPPDVFVPDNETSNAWDDIQKFNRESHVNWPGDRAPPPPPPPLSEEEQREEDEKEDVFDVRQYCEETLFFHHSTQMRDAQPRGDTELPVITPYYNLPQPKFFIGKAGAVLDFLKYAVTAMAHHRCSNPANTWRRAECSEAWWAHRYFHENTHRVTLDYDGSLVFSLTGFYHEMHPGFAGVSLYNKWDKIMCFTYAVPDFYRLTELYYAAVDETYDEGESESGEYDEDKLANGRVRYMQALTEAWNGNLDAVKGVFRARSAAGVSDEEVLESSVGADTTEEL